MKKILIIAIAAILSGCVVVPEGTSVRTTTVVHYEPDVYIRGIRIGEYRTGFGYWDGDRWDIYFYYRGHRGYGRYYRGAPRNVYRERHWVRRGPVHHYEHRKEDTLRDVRPRHDNKKRK